MSKPPADNNAYPALLRRVRAVLIEGRRRIEQERVRIYWETGRLIHTHILKNKTRAEYGGEVLERLARDLNVHVSVLRRCLQFRQQYPRMPIHARGREFSWSHYRKLITVGDVKKRLLLEKNAAAKGWTVGELSARAVKERPPDRRPLTPLRGELYTYRIVERPTLGPDEDSGLLIDCGFGFFRDPEPRAGSSLSKGDIVQSIPKEDAYRLSKTGRTVKDLFTYRAYVEKVVDGDTLKVRLDLGFDSWCRQVLRLRDLNCPEIDTKEGLAAKAFVQSHLKEASVIIVRSSRSDKYDRYLADVFIPAGGEQGEPDAETDLYLNNLLLEGGHAERVG